MKTTFIVDIESYLILLCKVRKRARHDVIDGEPMIKWLAKNYPDLYAFYGGRGYDKEEIFKLCFKLRLGLSSGNSSFYQSGKQFHGS